MCQSRFVDAELGTTSKESGWAGPYLDSRLPLLGLASYSCGLQLNERPIPEVFRYTSCAHIMSIKARMRQACALYATFVSGIRESISQSKYLCVVRVCGACKGDYMNTCVKPQVHTQQIITEKYGKCLPTNYL